MTTISADNLGLERSGARILANVSLSLGPTGSIAVIGPNGAGKSMMLKLLAGIETPSSGSVYMGGKSLARLSRAERSKAIGFVPQHFEPHWDLTVSELIRLGLERAGPASDALIEGVIVGFDLAAFSRRRWSTLSGGERARVLLAMVLAVDPPVLLADEPAASLDIRHRVNVVQTLTKRATDRLSIVVMHDLDLTFQYFERVIIVAAGSIAADGRASDLINDSRLDAAFGVQFERLRTAHGIFLRAT